MPARSDHLGESGPLGSCADFFASLDKRTKEAGALDPGDFRVKKYPYLRKSVLVPDDYITLRRVLGIYPLIRMFVSYGVSRWHAEAHESFSPEPPEKREALFRMHAPVWEIQFQGDYDRIGAPFWGGRSVLHVNTDQPVTCTLLSFTRFGKEIFVQLNYIIWFPSRPKKGAFDILGGILDGLNYRVTLDNNGDPLIYGTMHNCGFYYKAYATDRVQVR